MILRYTVVCLGFFWGGLCLAQPGQPRISYVYPAGGQVHTTLQVKIAGQNLERMDQVLVSGDGIHCAILDYTRPLNAKQAEQLRQTLEGLRNMPADPNRLREIARIRRLLDTVRPPNPTMAEVVTVGLSIDQSATVGPRQIRLYGPAGITNPLRFCVGRLAEFNEPASTLPQARGPVNKSRSATEVSIPIVVNGQILPGEVDRYSFKATTGQQVVAVVEARSLIPFLADAVPGWFQPRLVVYDQQGTPLAYCDDWGYDPDPRLHFTVPHDGIYTVELSDALFRGREDFVYRLTIGQVPWINAVFPLGAKVGRRVSLQVGGWNLPDDTLIQDNTGLEPGIYPVPGSAYDWALNTVPLLVDRSEGMTEADAKRAVLGPDWREPLAIDGVICDPGQEDRFVFEGLAGQRIVAEVFARRLGSWLDPVVTIMDRDGRRIGYCDDANDPLFGLAAHQADAYLAVDLPKDGPYQVVVTDAQGHGGQQYAYRLRIGPPKGSFDLMVEPSGIRLQAGSNALVTVHAVRRDNFSGPIHLSCPDQSFSIAGALIPQGCERLPVTISLGAEVMQGIYKTSIVGTASISGQVIQRVAVPVDRMMQAFAYEHLVPADGLYVLVSGRWPLGGQIRVSGPLPVRIPSGGSAEVVLKAARGFAAGRFEFELADPPDGVKIKETIADPAGVKLVIEAGKRVKAGLSGNLVVQMVNIQRPTQQGAEVRRPVVGICPAIPFTIIEW